MKRRAAALLLCLLLAAQMLLPGAAARSVYFTAVNNNILDLSDATMPFWSGGYMYVPSAIFTGQGRDLGVSHSYNAAKDIVTLYANGDTVRSLIFDLNKDHVVDNQGNLYFQAPIRRGGVIFLPISLIAQYFGLLYSIIDVPRGYLVWVRTRSADMPEKYFADAAGFPMESRYSQYLRQQEPERPESGIGETAGARPAAGKAIYLCMEAREADAVSAQLSALDQYGAQGAFYCTLDFLESQGALLRRMSATGQAVGLLVDGEDESRTVAEQLKLGNAALSRATCGKTRLVRLENAAEEDLRAAEAAGYRCLLPDLDRSIYPLGGSAAADTLLRRTGEHRGDVTVWLGGSATGAGLRAFLSAAGTAENRCLAMTETAA